MKKQFTIFLILASLLGIIPINLQAANLATKLKGKILLQVESNGEAWYVNPSDQIRYFLGRPDDAFGLMRKLGVGITNSNLYKIPIGILVENSNDGDSDGLTDYLEKTLGLNHENADTDGDGYSDGDELKSGYNPWGEGKQDLDIGFARQQSGKILLQVEKSGEAWYVNPDDNKRYFLGRPNDAFNVMRKLGMGINNNDLQKIALKNTNSNTETNNKPKKEILTEIGDANTEANNTKITEKVEKTISDIIIDLNSFSDDELKNYPTLNVPYQVEKLTFTRDVWDYIFIKKEASSNEEFIITDIKPLKTIEGTCVNNCTSPDDIFYNNYSLLAVNTDESAKRGFQAVNNPSSYEAITITSDEEQKAFNQLSKDMDNYYSAKITVAFLINNNSYKDLITELKVGDIITIENVNFEFNDVILKEESIGLTHCFSGVQLMNVKNITKK